MCGNCNACGCTGNLDATRLDQSKYGSDVLADGTQFDNEDGANGQFDDFIWIK